MSIFTVIQFLDDLGLLPVVSAGAVLFLAHYLYLLFRGDRVVIGELDYEYGEWEDHEGWDEERSYNLPSEFVADEIDDNLKAFLEELDTREF